MDISFGFSVISLKNQKSNKLRLILIFVAKAMKYCLCSFSFIFINQVKYFWKKTLQKIYKLYLTNRKLLNLFLKSP